MSAFNLSSYENPAFGSGPREEETMIRIVGLLAIVLVLASVVFLPLDAGATGLIDNIGVGQSPASVAVDSSTNIGYLANQGDNAVSFFGG
jgi:hypothetical protein